MIVLRDASFRSGTFDSAYGTRSYKLYVPAVAKAANVPLPLIVMLHGCGQTPEDFARGTGMNALAEEFGFLVLYPSQSRDAHLNRCWNWFKRDDQTRGAGEPALIASLTGEIVAELNVDPAKVYVAGLSAGASAALIVATAYPDIFAAVGVHSGLAVGSAHDTSSAARAMQGGNPGERHDGQMPTIIFHGTADRVVNPRNGRFVAIRALEPYTNLDQTEKSGRVLGGREFTRITHRVGKGRPFTDQWIIHGSGHAWSGGHAAGSYTDPAGPDASREMVRFFLRHRTTKKRRSTPRP
jgi:poly(hydroxyalkanoate) depolymerase family esterase